MPPEDRVRLQHMLDAARQAAEFAHTHTQSEMEPDALTTHGLVRLIEQFMDNESFRRWLTDTVFGLTYEQPAA